MTDDNFQNSWFNDYKREDLGEHFGEIKTYAYLIFDQLDANGNGFIEREELLNALNSPTISEREKSFITFLLNNHEQIVEAAEDSSQDGISRNDIGAYFDLIASLL
ncbi:hypothetical protein KF707_05335 [Candidatus Obscuribacterales bacterium]|nr:hypothetical protein [Candidatus Obscuribacterales bacterium]MBX3149250.1 hypothetical protein [Candidatus Obscuribacterales bacterium]